jgi:hypothetical protein
MKSKLTEILQTSEECDQTHTERYYIRKIYNLVPSFKGYNNKFYRDVNRNFAYRQCSR